MHERNEKKVYNETGIQSKQHTQNVQKEQRRSKRPSNTHFQKPSNCVCVSLSVSASVSVSVSLYVCMWRAQQQCTEIEKTKQKDLER